MIIKPPWPTLSKTTRPEIAPPFGGRARFISFLGQIGFAREVQPHLPFASNNAIPRAYSLTAFLLAVVVGARRFAHCEGRRADRVLHALLGLARFPSDDTIRNFFLRFKQAEIEAFWWPLWRWLLGLVQCPAAELAARLETGAVGYVNNRLYRWRKGTLA